MFMLVDLTDLALVHCLNGMVSFVTFSTYD